jgi:lipid-A-disaccharide synthase-like uncharacterized protein
MDKETWWLVLGFGGQALFLGRFVVQWLASERARRSVVPVAFWYLSIAGAFVLLGYAVHRRDPVFMAGQGLGVAIYLRNLRLIRRERERSGLTPEALHPRGRSPDPAAPDKTTPGAGRHSRRGRRSVP